MLALTVFASDMTNDASPASDQAANRTLVKARESAGQVINEAKQQVGGVRVQAAKSATKEFLQGLGGTMQQEMQTGRPAAAIKICRDVAPAMTNELSLAEGWKVARVSRRTARRREHQTAFT